LEEKGEKKKGGTLSLRKKGEEKEGNK